SKPQRGDTEASGPDRVLSATIRGGQLSRPPCLLLRTVRFRIVSPMPESGVVLSLDGRVAVVTGGSRGIGAGIVRLFTRAGAKVVFNYQKARAEAERLAEECGGEQRCAAVQADLSSAGSTHALVAAAVAQFGRVDIVVGNHGVWPPHDAPIDQMSDDQWR